MKAATARVIYSFSKVAVISASKRHDKAVFPSSIELGNEPPAVSILRAFVTLTTSGLRPKHVSQEFCEID
jgi:hypothetical protein